MKSVPAKPRAAGVAGEPSAPAPDRRPVLWWIRRALLALGVLGGVALLGRHGFPDWTPGHRWCEALVAVGAGALVLELALELARGPKRTQIARERRVDYALIGLTLTALAVIYWALSEGSRAALQRELTLASPGELAKGPVQLFLAATLVLRFLRGMLPLLARGVPSELLFAGSFAFVIAIGAGLLLLPGMHPADRTPINLVDALFTSTSAVCVTGLAVRDTALDFSALGQVLILLLIQVGGLGIITFVAFGSVLSNKRLAIPGVITLREFLGARSLNEVWSALSYVVWWALGVELLGCVALWIAAPSDGGTLVQRGFWSLFHSVSAFCNAGFSLQSDSLVRWRGSLGVNGIVMALIVIGGLGMPVARELIAYRATRSPFFRRFEFFRRLHDGRVHKRLSLQARLALWTSAILIVVGTLGIFLLERRSLAHDMPVGQELMAAAFQSVSARTAGFNTLDVGALQDGSTLLLIGLMVIGASPVSTGGGIKTVTFAVLVITLRSMVTGRNKVECGRRTIPIKIVRTAISVFLLYVIAATSAVFGLAITDPDMDMTSRVFEAVSALSTVGLSRGVTAEFSVVGKLILCTAMFIGRVGPLALMLSVFRRSKQAAEYSYPEEDLIVG